MKRFHLFGATLAGLIITHGETKPINTSRKSGRRDIVQSKEYHKVPLFLMANVHMLHTMLRGLPIQAFVPSQFPFISFLITWQILLPSES